MNAYVWERIDCATFNYHPEGGLLVIARDEAHARELIAGRPNIEVSDEEWGQALVLGLEGEAEPRVIVFPDAGCC